MYNITLVLKDLFLLKSTKIFSIFIDSTVVSIPLVNHDLL